jgi:MFS family permease
MSSAREDAAPVARGPMSSVRGWTHRTFSSLKLRNYRLYFIGQGISLSGTWMQSVGQSWLVLKLTGSGSALGITMALQFLPVLIFAPYGGVLADRFSKRRLLYFTQSAAAVLALTLGTLVATDVVRLWMVYALAFSLGLVNSLDNPVRQSFVHEMVGAETLRNAVTLNALEVNLSRAIGPALAGAIIVSVGIAPCFFVNGFSFVAVLVCLYLMKGGELQPTTPVKAAKGQIRQGFAYVRANPLILDVLIMMAIVGTLTYEFNVTLSLLAKFTFHGSAGTFALLTSATGVGAVIGGLWTAGRRTAAIGGLTAASFAFGASTLAVAVAPTIHVAVLGMIVVGAFSIVFTSLTNTILQLEAAPAMRGRVMSLWTVAFLGSTVVGAPVVGWVGEHVDPRWALAVGGIAALIAGAVGLLACRSGRCTPAPEHAVEPPSMTEKTDQA